MLPVHRAEPTQLPVIIALSPDSPSISNFLGNDCFGDLHTVPTDFLVAQESTERGKVQAGK